LTPALPYADVISWQTSSIDFKWLHADLSAEPDRDGRATCLDRTHHPNPAHRLYEWADPLLYITAFNGEVLRRTNLKSALGRMRAVELGLEFNAASGVNRLRSAWFRW
jgi:hypothetical protein